MPGVSFISNESVPPAAFTIPFFIALLPCKEKSPHTHDLAVSDYFKGQDLLTDK